MVATVYLKTGPLSDISCYTYAHDGKMFKWASAHNVPYNRNNIIGMDFGASRSQKEAGKRVPGR